MTPTRRPTHDAEVADVDRDGGPRDRRVDRVAARGAADWLRSDWAPAGTSLSDDAAKARMNVLRRVAEIKQLVDECKNDLDACRTDRTE